MSSASTSITNPLVGTDAANADDLGETQRLLVQAKRNQSIESTAGWDAYEVWRRFIKEARDRRRQQK